MFQRIETTNKHYSIKYIIQYIFYNIKPHVYLFSK